MHPNSIAAGVVQQAMLLTIGFNRGLWLSLLPLLAMALSAGLTYSLISVAPRQGWVVVPAANRWNRRTVAQFGGIPIVLVFLLASLFVRSDAGYYALLFLTCGMSILGLADDLIGLGPVIKLVPEVALAAIAVSFGFIYPLTPDHHLNQLISVFWIVGITNSLNLLDNMDGIAGGVGLIGLCYVAIFAGFGTPIAFLSLCLAAGIAGFLFFNFNPARIFMGDTGALAIGFFLGCATTVAARNLSGRTAAVLAPCLILFVPLFDTALVSVSRRMHGRRISRGARDHTSHRLVFLGCTERQTARVIYLATIVSGSLMLLWKGGLNDIGPAIVVIFVLSAVLSWVFLIRLRLPETWLSVQDAIPITLSLVPRTLVSAFAAPLSDAVLVVSSLYLVFVVRAHGFDRFSWEQVIWVATAALIVKLACLAIFGVYSRRSRAKENGWTNVAIASAMGSVALALSSYLLYARQAIPTDAFVFDFTIATILLILRRTFVRILENRLSAAGSLRLQDATNDVQLVVCRLQEVKPPLGSPNGNETGALDTQHIPRGIA
jgi:UDP-GlcNAc:undecaprenyl-phosphate GlcNAc-1-phosphate transferase